MKRIVILIDGTWNDENIGEDTNIARLDTKNHKIASPLIKASAGDQTEQLVIYHRGVGAEPDIVKRLLGGAIGLGLKQIVQDAYRSVVGAYEHGDELYLIGFSRGAYAVRALAGMIGISGILRAPHGSNSDSVEAAWQNYRASPGDKPAAGYGKLTADDAFHSLREIKAVCVFDTVGSYGVPAGFGLAPLARYVAWKILGFHDTQFGDHVDVGLHAVAVDERRRPFVPTFWTARKGAPPRGHVEQTWFAGVHCNIGGGYADSGLSDAALIWMIARLQALTKLEFDVNAVRTETQGVSIDGEVVNSSQGWPIDTWLPHLRIMLSPDAIVHGALLNSPDAKQEHVNERAHWSVLAKRGRPCTYYGKPQTPYGPPNLPATISVEKIAEQTPEEKAFWPSAPSSPRAASSPIQTPA
jgi:uncharacterized protein (DUF2235 family)